MKSIAWSAPAVGIVFIAFLGSVVPLAADQGSVSTDNAQPNAPSDACTAVISYVAAQNLSAEMRNIMLETVQRYPTASSWTGRDGNQLFAIATRRLPEGQIRQRALPNILRVTNAVAMSELLKTKAVLNAYEVEGLTNEFALRIAVGRLAERFDVTGSVRGSIHQTATQENFAVGYVIADIANVASRLQQPPLLVEIKNAYRDANHVQMRTLMERRQWLAAYEHWEHLQKLKLTPEAYYVDAIRCLVQLNREAEAVQTAQIFLDEFHLSASPSTLEQIGDLLLVVDSLAAQEMATMTYRAASKRLHSFRIQEKLSSEILSHEM